MSGFIALPGSQSRPVITFLRRLLRTHHDNWTRAAVRQRDARYWFRRQRLARIRFSVARQGFAAKDFGRGTTLSFSLASQILRGIAPAALLAAVMVAALGLIGAHVPTRLLTLRWLAPSARFIAKQGDRSAQISLYSTAAQIAGVFLGLYFTALSVVASTSYKDVPADLRGVVTEERAGTMYLTVVAYAGAAALLCLAALAVDLSPGVLNAAAVSILSTASVLSFVMLGLRAFTFFDPASVATYLTGRILDAARASTPGGYAWDDSSFQNHRHRLAARAATSLGQLVTVVATSTNTGSRLSAVGSRALAALTLYSQLKPDIPLDSYWFERVPRHESWLTASSSSIEMAVRTGTGIQPTETPDALWLETRLITVASEATRLLLDREEYEEAASVLQQALQCMESLAERWQLDVALAVYHRLLPLLARALRPVATNSDSTTRRDRSDIYRLAAVDALVAGPCAVIAATGRAANKLNPEFVTSLAGSRVAAAGKMPLGSAVPVGVRATLRFFGGALDFERSVEGKPITPAWFVAHHAARIYCRDMRNALDQLYTLCRETYGPFTAARTEPNVNPEDAVLIVQRGREACDKLQGHGEAMAAAIIRLQELKRAFGEQAWEGIDTNANTDKAQQLDAQLLRMLGRVVPELPTAPPSGRLPDSLGFALTTLADEAFAALIGSDDSLFADLFRPYLIIALQAYDRSRVELADRDREIQLLVSLDLLVEIAELSGYAYLVSNTLGGKAWDAVRAVWDGLLSSLPEPQRLASLVLLGDSYRDSLLGFHTNRDLLRTGWAQGFASVMTESHFVGDRHGSPWDNGQAVLCVPIDPLAHAYLRHLSFMQDARDVFFVAYLAQRPEVAGVELPRGAAKLSEERDRIIGFRNEAIKDGSGPFGERQQRARRFL